MAPVGRTRPRWWIAVGVALGVVALTVGGGWAYYLNEQLDDVRRVHVDLGSDGAPGGAAPGVRARESAEERSDNESLTILVAGVDAGDAPRIADSMAQGDWPQGEYRTDTVMLVHLTADRRSAYVISVPRDSWVRIPGYGRNKVNAAFSLGGPSLFAETVQRLTRTQIDHLMIVDWQAFKKLTTAIGGVEVRIPRDVHDPSQKVTWEAGVHRLEGQEALQYVRQRHGLPRGDLDRVRRQQNFVRATLEKTMSDGTLHNPVRLTRVLKAVTEHLVVDDGLSDKGLRQLALSTRGLSREQVTFLTAPTDGLDRVGGQSVVRVDHQQTRRLFAALEARKMESYLRENEADLLPESGRVS